MRRLCICIPVIIGALWLAQSAGALPPTPPSTTRSTSALAHLTIAVAGPSTGYSRARFGGWETVSGTCDTRETVIKRDGRHVTTDAACHATAGTWTSFYDGQVIHASSKLDIDHIVPLENAWISGARAWTGAQRHAFANDLADDQLIAVSASANRSKGDRSPDEGTPPRQATLCRYARWWIDVKAVWKLTITQPEHDALASMLTTC